MNSSITDGDKLLLERAKEELRAWKFGYMDRLQKQAYSNWEQTYKRLQEQLKMDPENKQIQKVVADHYHNRPEIRPLNTMNPPQWYIDNVARTITMYESTLLDSELDGYTSTIRKGIRVPITSLNTKELFNLLWDEPDNNRKRDWMELKTHFGVPLKSKKDFDNFYNNAQRLYQLNHLIGRKFEGMDEQEIQDEVERIGKKYHNAVTYGEQTGLIPVGTGRGIGTRDFFTIGSKDPVMIFAKEPTIYHATWSVIVKDALTQHDGYIYPRGLHYYLKGKQQRVPDRFAQERWNPDGDDGFAPYGTIKDDYDDYQYLTGDVLNPLRYYGFIPQESIGDKRTTERITFADHKFYEGAELPRLEVKVGLTDTKFTQLDIPQIILFTEKSHISPLLEQIANKYIMGYFAASGQMSIRSSYDFYQDVKRMGGQAIIFTLNDFDTGGLSITQSFARKIQRHALEDRDLPDDKRPNIIIIPLIFQKKDLINFQQAGIHPNEKEGKKDKKLMIHYYIDQIYEYAAKKGITPMEYIIERIKDYISTDLIRERQQLTESDMIKKREFYESLHEAIGISNLDEVFDELMEKVKADGRIQKLNNWLDNQIPEDHINRTIIELGSDNIGQIKYDEEIDKLYKKYNGKPPREEIDELERELLIKPGTIFKTKDEIALDSEADFWSNTQLLKQQTQLKDRWADAFLKSRFGKTKFDKDEFDTITKEELEKLLSFETTPFS